MATVSEYGVFQVPRTLGMVCCEGTTAGFVLYTVCVLLALERRYHLACACPTAMGVSAWKHTLSPSLASSALPGKSCGGLVVKWEGNMYTEGPAENDFSTEFI